MAKRLGDALFFDAPPALAGFAAAGGKRESEGPLAPCFDLLEQDTTFGERTWEQSESRLQQLCAAKALEKCGLAAGDLDLALAGDLENQCTASSTALRALGLPYAGLYSACATSAEGLILAGCLVEAGLARRVLAMTSSHFCAAERQFRFPLEYGGKRTPTSQWTATAAGAAVLGPGQAPPYVRAVTFGRIVDLGVRDAANMGAAMAPAAADTLCRFFRDTGLGPDRFDLVLTGDLGQVGSQLLCQLMEREGNPLGRRHSDCGLMLYDKARHPQVGAGGSGCGCSAAVLCGRLLDDLRSGALHDLLFAATGALMSPTASQQGESIPGVAHLVWLSSAPQEE